MAGTSLPDWLHIYKEETRGNFMKRGLSLAFVYIGLVIGAGFASGREVMEYFNFPSRSDHSGIVLATFLLIVLCYIILHRANTAGVTTYEEYLSLVAGKMARPVKLFMLFYLFCGFFTMLAGSGALLSQNYMLPPIAGVLLLAGVCFLVLTFDLKGIVAVNTLLVPCMIAGILYLCITAALFGTASAFSLHRLTGGVLTSAICYVSYNTISAASVLVPLQKGMGMKEIRIAAVVGGFVLGLLILVIWAGQNLFFDALWNSEIPMLKLAAMTGRTQKQVYAAILFMAILTTAVSQGFGILCSFGVKKTKERCFLSGMLCFLAIPFALLGFSNLVAYLYAFFGVVGILWMGWVLLDYFWLSRS